MGAWSGSVKPLVPMAVTPGHLDLAAPSLLVKKRIEGEYFGEVVNVLSSTAGRPMTVTVHVQGDTIYWVDQIHEETAAAK